MPKFSIIVPVYQAENYLNKCIDSILNQRYEDFEVIIVDDGSYDRSSFICDEYERLDQRVRVIHKKNEGVSMARQNAVDIATGDYLVFVDADDSITDDCLQEIVAHDGVDIVRYGIYVEKKNGEVREMLPREREGAFSKTEIQSEIFSYLIQGERANYYAPSLCVHAFKRKLFLENMVRDKVLVIGEDGACVMPCVYNAESIYCIKKCLYRYNYNENSATKGRKIFPWTDPANIGYHLSTRIDFTEQDFLKQIYRKLVHEFFSVVISQFNRKEKYYVIKKDILFYMEQEPYKEAIEKAEFKGSLKAALMVFAFRYKQIWMMWVYSKIKK